MPSILKVALVGKGYLGEKVYDELIQAGFQVTILTRSSSHGAPNIRTVDYDSETSIKEALAGLDAVVSTISTSGWANQHKLIDLANECGIQHFIPSDFTALSTFHKNVEDLPFYNAAIGVQKHLAKTAKTTGLKWTVIATGPIIGCVLNGNYMYNFTNRSALLTSDADRPFCMTRRQTIGKAIAQVLKLSTDLESGPIYIRDCITTQRQLLTFAETASGSQWTIETSDGEEKLKQGLAMYKSAGQDAPPVFATFLVIHGSIFSGNYGQVSWDEKGNQLLGIEPMSKEELRELIHARVRGEWIDGGLPWNSAPKPRK